MKGEFENILPLGICKDGKWLRNYKLVDLDNEAFKMIRDRNFMRSHPMKWTAMVISLTVDSIEEESVASKYVASGLQTIPEIVYNLPVADSAHIIINAHSKEFGSIINELPAVCHLCEKEGRYDFDLSTLNVTYADEPIEHIEVELNTGYFKPKTDKAGLGIEDKYWTKYLIEVPDMSAAIRNEGHYKINDRGTFEERVLGDTGMQIFDKEGIQMDESVVKQLNYRLIDKLRPRDKLLINRKIAELPQVDLRGKIRCENCSRDTWIGVDPSFFFPRV